jgi:hypothetical protein
MSSSKSPRSVQSGTISENNTPAIPTEMSVLPCPRISIFKHKPLAILQSSRNSQYHELMLVFLDSQGGKGWISPTALWKMLPQIVWLPVNFLLLRQWYKSLYTTFHWERAEIYRPVEAAVGLGLCHYGLWGSSWLFERLQSNWTIRVDILSYAKYVDYQAKIQVRVESGLDLISSGILGVLLIWRIGDKVTIGRCPANMLWCRRAWPTLWIPAPRLAIQWPRPIS